MISFLDPSDLKGDLDSWPSLAERSWKDFTSIPKLPDNVEGIVLAGMGGSGIAGDLICDISAEKSSKLMLFTNKDYHLPKWVDGRFALVAISCSGNTEETLSVVAEARARGIECFGIGSGGLLKKFAQEKWNFPFIQTGMLKVPRTSLPALFFPLVKLFSENSILKVDQEDLDDCFNSLNKVKELSGKLKNLRSNPSFEIAQQLASNEDRLLIYSSRRTRAVGLRFRQSLNENAKMHAFNGEIPELCHNDIVGWDLQDSRIQDIGEKSKRLVSTKSAEKRKRRSFAAEGHSSSKAAPSNGLALLLRLREDDPEEIRVRFDVVSDVIRRRNGIRIIAPYFGKSFIARTFSMLYSLEYSTYFAAVLRGINPILTPSIDLLKKEMTRKLGFVGRIS
jgi:glucose/mannose-6-phosphate isomerase